MFEKSFDLLSKKGISFDEGLSLEELDYIENLYKIEFPKSLRDFLMYKMPISNGFYNWRNTNKDNVEYLNKVMKLPFDNIYNMANEVYWCDDWGDEPDEEVCSDIIREKFKKAPKLIPIYSHRYIPMISIDNPPIISIHGVDIICYGTDLEEYIDIEFGDKNQDAIQYEKVYHIDFWSDIM